MSKFLFNIIPIAELILLIASIVAHPAFMVAFIILFFGTLIWCDREDKKEANAETVKKSS